MRTLKNLSLGIFLVGALAGVALLKRSRRGNRLLLYGAIHDASADRPAACARLLRSIEAINRMIAREHDEVATIRRYTPIIETYMQDMKPDKDLGQVPVSDHYFLGQANLQRGVVDNSMLEKKKGQAGRIQSGRPLSAVISSLDFVPEGFLQMIYLDTSGFDRAALSVRLRAPRISRRCPLRRV